MCCVQIPLMMTPDYQPRGLCSANSHWSHYLPGWLGIITGTKLYYECFSEEMLSEKMPEIIKVLKWSDRFRFWMRTNKESRRQREENCAAAGWTTERQFGRNWPHGFEGNGFFFQSHHFTCKYLGFNSLQVFFACLNATAFDKGRFCAASELWVDGGSDPTRKTKTRRFANEARWAGPKSCFGIGPNPSLDCCGEEKIGRWEKEDGWNSGNFAVQWKVIQLMLNSRLRRDGVLRNYLRRRGF